MHGLNECHIAPYTDTEFQLSKYQTYIVMKSQDKSLQLIFEETILLLREIESVKQMGWIGLHLFNDDTRPQRHIRRLPQVGFFQPFMLYKQITGVQWC